MTMSSNQQEIFAKWHQNLSSRDDTRRKAEWNIPSHVMCCPVGWKGPAPATWLHIRVDSVNFQDGHCLWIFSCVLWTIIIDERLDSEILSVFSPECYKFFCKKECICTRVRHAIYKTLNGDLLQPCPSSCFKLGRVSNFSNPLFYVPTRWFLTVPNKHQSQSSSFSTPPPPALLRYNWHTTLCKGKVEGRRRRGRQRMRWLDGITVLRVWANSRR